MAGGRHQDRHEGNRPFGDKRVSRLGKPAGPKPQRLLASQHSDSMTFIMFFLFLDVLHSFLKIPFYFPVMPAAFKGAALLFIVSFFGHGS
ncbi:hypothetical protein BXP28_00655 [Paenibacillus larvae subsp. larvae]|nr:hypothetical protein BXP28_00655 [Paenibacillus larvae subsp. larvae]